MKTFQPILHRSARAVLLFPALLLLPLCPLSAPAQTPPDPQPQAPLMLSRDTAANGNADGWLLSAPPVPGRVYFLQTATNPAALSSPAGWTYNPTVKLGTAGVPLEYHFPASGDVRRFFRLRFTAETTFDATTAQDIDRDGASNMTEIAAGTDPFNADSDGDGMPDGWELKYALNPLSAADASLDPDGDGMSNLLEFQLGTIPQGPNSLDSDGDRLTDAEEYNGGNGTTNPARFDMPIISLMAWSREATLEDWRQPSAANRHTWTAAGTYRDTRGSGFNGSGTTKGAWLNPGPWQVANAINPGGASNSFLDEIPGALSWGTEQSTGSTISAWLRQTWSWESPYRVARVRVRQVRYFLRASRAMPLELKVQAVITPYSREGFLDAAWTAGAPLNPPLTLTLAAGAIDSNQSTFNPADSPAVTPPATTDANPRTVGDKYYTVSLKPFPYSITAGDLDGDGLPNEIEDSMGTSKTNADSDGDGRPDFFDFVSTRPGTLAPTGPRAAPSSATEEEQPVIEYVWREGHVCPGSDFSKSATDTNIAVHSTHWDFGVKENNLTSAPADPTAAMKDSWSASPVYALSLPGANAPPAAVLDETKDAGTVLRSYNMSTGYTGGSPASPFKGGDSREALFRLRRETAGPNPVSRKFVLIDRQKADSTASAWTYNSITPYTLTIAAGQTGSPAVAPAANVLRLPAEITPAPGKKSLREIISLPISIIPDLNMAGVIGDVIPSADPASTIKHFVSPKQVPDPVQHFVELKAWGIQPAEFNDQLVWEAGTAGASPEKRKVSRSATGTEATKVRLRSKTDNSIIDEMQVWVVWADVEYEKLDSVFVTTPSGERVRWQSPQPPTPGWRFKFKIKPAAICSAGTAEKPALSGNKKQDPPGSGKIYAVDPTRGDGDNTVKKWDVSRQAQARIPNPLFTATRRMRQEDWPSIYINRMNKSDPLALKFPVGDAEGNDDPRGEDEEDNPYAPYVATNPLLVALNHAAGELSSFDSPVIYIPNAWGESAPPRFSIEINFREFARLELWDGRRIDGKYWFRISDYFNWHHYMDVTFDSAAGVWRNTPGAGASSSGIGHPRP